MIFFYVEKHTQTITNDGIFSMNESNKKKRCVNIPCDFKTFSRTLLIFEYLFYSVFRLLIFYAAAFRMSSTFATALGSSIFSTAASSRAKRSMAAW